MDDFEKEYGELLKNAPEEIKQKCRERYDEWQKLKTKDKETHKLVLELRKATGDSYLNCRAAVIESDNNYEKALKILWNKSLEERRKWSKLT